MAKDALKLIALIAAAVGGQTSTAMAQSWEAAPGGESVQAVSAVWPSGMNMVVRCREQSALDVLISLAQPVSQAHVAVTATLGGETTDEHRWRLAPGGEIIFARQPARLVRAMIRGEPVAFTVNPSSGPTQAWELDSPGQPDLLSGILETCGRATETPAVRGTGTGSGQPTAADIAANYPPAAARNGVEGAATVECRVSAGGRLEDCIVLAEGPRGAGFGRATLNLAEGFQMRSGDLLEEDIVTIPIRWRPQ